VDENLCQQLTFNPRVKCLASVGESFSIGTLESDKLFAWFNGNRVFTAYEMIPELEQDGVPFSVLVQKSGLVRVIDATNKDLQELIKRGEFRSDLYYRINIVELRLPALRKRGSDIPLLAHFFLKKYAELYRKNIVGLSPEVEALFCAYDWPGNLA